MQISILPVAFVGLIIFAVVLSGCIDESAENVTPNISTNSTQDPIIGTWHWTVFGQSKTIFYTFTSDGHYTTSDSINEGTESGTWIKSSGNQYNISVNNRKIVFVYQPETNTIAITDSPELHFYPPGKGSAIVTAKPVQPTQSNQPASGQPSTPNYPAVQPVYTPQKSQVVVTIGGITAPVHQPQPQFTMEIVTLPPTIKPQSPGTPQPGPIFPLTTFKKP